jgi:hypothetical protein
LNQKHLLDSQIKLLTSIIPGLLTGAISKEWIVMKERDGGRYRIDHIKGFRGDVWENVWKGVIEQSDLDVFVQNGVFIRTDENTYSLNVQAIINAADYVQSQAMSANTSNKNEIPNQELPDERRVGDEYDFFISHASEDKVEIATPLANALSAKKYRVWYDEFSLKLGDSLRRTIEKGLSQSKYGIIILSPNFFAKEWPQRELDGFVALNKKLLPIWHDVDAGEVAKFSPILADIVAIRSSLGIDIIVQKIIHATQASPNLLPASIVDESQQKQVEIQKILHKIIDNDEEWSCGYVDLIRIDQNLVAATDADEFQQIEILNAMEWKEPSRDHFLLSAIPRFTKSWQALSDDRHIKKIADEIIQINLQVHELSIKEIRIRKVF